MATRIVTKSGSGAPTASDLVAGELAVDLTNGRLYTEDSGGTVLELGTNPASDVTFGDNTKAIFGAGSDLQIYHDGSNSYIDDAGTGNLRIRGSQVILEKYTGETILQGIADGSVYIFHDNAEKLATTSTGIDVTGSVTADGLTVDGDITQTTGDLLYSGGINWDIKHTVAGQNIVFSTTPSGGSTTDRMRIASSGNVGIGVVPESHYTGYVGIDFGKSGGLFSNTSGTNLTGLSNNAYLNSDASAWVYKETDEASYYNQTAGTHRFSVAPSGTAGTSITWSEAMRIDASGNLLVGKTATGGNTSGMQVVAGSFFSHVRDGGVVQILNRKTSDGSILEFEKDNTTVGSIACRSSGGNLQIHTNESGIDFGGSGYLPMRGSTITDNNLDIGSSSFRFNDAYVTNGVTTGSDGNDKQDIETLSDAEQRVAVACKGLLRKWRWKDAVEAKGDDARIHFGIIAQDLQAAFEAEGLDAGRYAMFMSNTWTDEETGEERTRLGVRYHELLAFIIAAI